MNRPTLRRVRSLLGRTLPGATISATWTEPPRLVTYPTGLRGYRAKVAVTAPGFRPTVMTVTSDADSLMIR